MKRWVVSIEATFKNEDQAESFHNVLIEILCLLGDTANAKVTKIDGKEM